MTLDRTWPATVCLFLAAYPSFGVERAELVSLSTVCGEEYRALRDRIVNEGPEALPILDEMVGNETESWKVRLVSGVCAERIRCKDAFRVVEQANWSDVLRADPRWPYTAAGYQREIVPLYHRWLEQHGLWYYGLERYSEWDGRTRAGLERTLDSFVLDRSRGIHRWFAAKIAEEFARDYLDGRNPYCGIEVDRLRRFVLDGTLSSGAFVFLDHASDDRRTSAGTIAEFLPFVDDRSYLVKLAERCQEMESKNGIIRKRIENLDALASTNETRTMQVSSRDERLHSVPVDSIAAVNSHSPTGKGPEEEPKEPGPRLRFAIHLHGAVLAIAVIGIVATISILIILARRKRPAP